MGLSVSTPIHPDRTYVATYVCDLTGATPRQLRYWDRIGLAKPSVQTTGGKPGVPRRYSGADVIRIRMIVHLLYEGMSLQQLRKRLARGGDLTDIYGEFMNRPGRLNRPTFEEALLERQLEKESLPQ